MKKTGPAPQGGKIAKANGAVRGTGTGCCHGRVWAWAESARSTARREKGQNASIRVVQVWRERERGPCQSGSYKIQPSSTRAGKAESHNTAGQMEEGGGDREPAGGPADSSLCKADRKKAKGARRMALSGRKHLNNCRVRGRGRRGPRHVGGAQRRPAIGGVAHQGDGTKRGPVNRCRVRVVSVSFVSLVARESSAQRRHGESSKSFPFPVDRMRSTKCGDN